MEFLNLEDVLMLHADIIAESGGSERVRDNTKLTRRKRMQL